MPVLRLIVIFTGSLLTSCTVGKVVAPAPVSPFLAKENSDTTARNARLPFDHSWRSPDVDVSKYQHIVVRPVSVKWLRKEQWTDSESAYVPDRARYLKECGRLANYWTKSLKEAFSSPVCVFYITNDTSKPGTLVLEVALTEVNFGRPPAGLGNMAFEARVKDASTGKTIATVADRRATVSKIADFNQKTLKRANEEILDQWSGQLMEASNRELFPVVRSTLPTPF